MGKRGPRPKPTNLRVLHGDRKDRINTDEPVAPDGLPQPPYDMAEDVRAVWDYTVEQLRMMGTVSTADRDVLVCFCEAVVTHRKASKALAGTGILIRTRRGDAFMRNPVLQVQRDAAQTIRGLAQEFGLTPSARSEINMGGARTNGSGAERLLS